jgi:carboxymethylenebutenolidase
VCRCNDTLACLPRTLPFHPCKRSGSSRHLASTISRTCFASPVFAEWWGLDESIFHQAKKLNSATGFRVLIPDLYRGKLGVDAEEASHLFSHLDWKGAVADLVAAADYLKKTEGSKKVASLGFCMGGALALAGAVHAEGNIDAAVPFYGTPQDQLADVSTIKCAVQGHFGKKDTMAGFSDPAAAEALKVKLEKAGVEHNVYLYDNVGHAFMNELPSAIERRSKLGQGEHHQESVDSAFGRTVEFLKAKLLA